MTFKNFIALVFMAAFTAFVSMSLPHDFQHDTQASVLESGAPVEVSDEFLAVTSQTYQGYSQTNVFLVFDTPKGTTEDEIIQTMWNQLKRPLSEISEKLEIEPVTTPFEPEDSTWTRVNYRTDTTELRFQLDVFLDTDDPNEIATQVTEALNNITEEQVSNLFCFGCPQEQGALVYGSVIITDLFGADKPEPVAFAEPVQEDPFTDVSSDYSYLDAVNFVKTEGIVQGYSDGTYKPDNNINRAEFTKILIGAAYFDEMATAGGSDCFSDVSAADWFAKYVCFAKDRGIIGGYPDGTFKPAQNINIAEALKITLEVYFDSIPDAPGDWFQKYWNFADTENYLLTEWTSAASGLTRGAMAELIYRINQ